MRKLSAILASALLLIFAAQFTACEKYVLPEVSVSPDTLRFGAAVDSQRVFVTTNVITTIRPGLDAVWITTNPDWFDGSCYVTISVSENEDGKERTAVLPVHSEVISRDLVVIQEGKPQEPEQPSE